VKASLVIYVRVEDELENTVEVKVWQLPKPSPDKPHGYKYSLVYIVKDVRVIGYDNAEGQGDHRHYRDRQKPYTFQDIDKLLQDFYGDIERYKRGEQP